MRASVAIAAFAAAVAAPGRSGAEGVERIALVGSTFIEREQEYGYLETRLAIGDPTRVRVVRNLGRSGDNVRGESRAGFGTPADGFRQLRQQVLDFRPTTIFVCYGAVESFEGPSGLPRFREGLGVLLDMLAESGAKLILASSPLMEDLGRPLPDPTAHNLDLGRYRDAIREAAEARKVAFLDLAGASDGPARAEPHRTDDGLQYNAFGYWDVSRRIALDGFGVGPAPWKLDLDFQPNQQKGPTWPSFSGLGEITTQVIHSNTGMAIGLRLGLRARNLPSPRAPGAPAAGDLPRLSIRELGPADATYPLRSDGRVLRTPTAAAWAGGISLDSGPDFDQVEQLRRVIVAKNRLFFYRWRPQNETYLFGFRKHEQGNNAREIPMFDPLVAAAEAEIEKLSVPVVHTYEIVREGEVPR